jgi:hypothetical protein
MIGLKAPLQRFTVRETSPGINHGEPAKPLYWHWSVEARQALRALRGLDPAAPACRGASIN